MKKIIFALLLVTGLSACGVKGPLYFPENPQSNQQNP